MQGFHFGETALEWIKNGGIFIKLNDYEEIVSNNLTYPPFSSAGQRRAKSIVAVIQILICFADDAFKVTGQISSIINQQGIISPSHTANSL